MKSTAGTQQLTEKVREFYFDKRSINMIVRELGRSLEKKFKGCLDSVLVYGSNSTGAKTDSLIDFILLTNDHKRFFARFLEHFSLNPSRSLRNLAYVALGYNKLCYHLKSFEKEPNIYMAYEGDKKDSVGYKFNVVRTDTWQREMGGSREDWYWFGRFMKITPVLSMREELEEPFVQAVSGAIRTGFETALILAANEKIEADSEEVNRHGSIVLENEEIMRYYMNLSYICDRRVEPDDKWKKLLAQNPEAYAAFFAVCLNEMRKKEIVSLPTGSSGRTGILLEPEEVKKRAAHIYSTLFEQRASFAGHNRSNVWTNIFWPEYCLAKIGRWRQG
ncbi:hypothetical protein GF371_04295 [Candidatus Woesearchaeota archaeon]|nr:hypothetical protein [Candidatus Woesearchaeota archaeon]